MPSAPRPAAVLGFFSATAIVVASMIGTGIFTTTGLLAADIKSPAALLLVWVVGGLLALCGALSYGELTAALPRSGGEYHFLGRIYHPLWGFLAGWVSIVAGFSAPIAAAAIACSRYLVPLWSGSSPLVTAVVLIVSLSLLHAADVRLGAGVQNFFTVLKVVLILAFIGGGVWRLPAVPAPPAPVYQGALVPDLLAPAFAVGLIFVSFAYAGWNGAVYILSEIKQAPRTVPAALLTGTLIVMALYAGLNWVFLRSLPVADLAGVVEVGHLAAGTLFGSGVGLLVDALIALTLVSFISAMIMTGSRVIYVMGEDIAALRLFSRTNRRGVPVAAIAIQSLLALGLAFSFTFDQLLNTIGFTLSLSTGLAVAGVVVLRIREPDLERPVRTWGYPLVPLVYVLLTLWMVVHNLWERPLESLLGVTILALGALLYGLLNRRPRGKGESAA